MKIAGLWNGHDCSFCIFENNKPTIHAEYERYLREKNPKGDAFLFMNNVLADDKIEDIKYFATCYPTLLMTKYSESLKKIEAIINKNDGKFFVFPHHKSHAAHAFYSSKFKKAITVTFDGGGTESDNRDESACTVWECEENKINLIRRFNPLEINIGGVWTRIIRYVFKLQNGWPRGGQEGSVMAMASYGDPDKYFEDFYKMLTVDKIPAGFKPPDQPPGAYIEGKDPVHPYLDPWLKISERSEQDMFDLAASFQKATEAVIREILALVFNNYPDCEYLCLSGGVALNTVAMGKIKSWFPNIKDIYIPPVPADAGLTIGACQLVAHEVLNLPRAYLESNFCPYLGQDWGETELNEALALNKDKIKVTKSSDDDILKILDEQKIVSVFNGKSESGRRALGNRSILADPRDIKIKKIINDRVKHRQWYRPFAPSILSECVSDWFDHEIESSYMQFVLPVKEDKKSLIPAAVHNDGTARLQTVSEVDNPWYYNFIKKWSQISKVPILLNTSFNDREPIVESPEHALSCFLKTSIDVLYFPEFKLKVERKI